MFLRRTALVCGSAAAVLVLGAIDVLAEASISKAFHTDVDLVTLSFSVTDAQGRYIGNLKPAEIRVYEDGIEQQVATFATPSDPSPVDNSVFLLLNTSNSMYEDFMRAADIVTSFVRGIHERNGVAVYTFSRNMYRATPLTHDTLIRVSALRNPVLGDETAVFNSLLLTVRDAAKVPGNKTVVLLSNGPDTASIVSPMDVARVAREEGIPIHVIYTTVKDEVMDSAFRRIAATTGGEAHPARNWEQQEAAFNLIRDDLLNSYTVAYYPKPSDKDGFRKITVEVVTDDGHRFRVHARPGYKPGHRSPIPCTTCSFARTASPVPYGAPTSAGASR